MNKSKLIQLLLAAATALPLLARAEEGLPPEGDHAPLAGPRGEGPRGEIPGGRNIPATPSGPAMPRTQWLRTRSASALRYM